MPRESAAPSKDERKRPCLALRARGGGDFTTRGSDRSASPVPRRPVAAATRGAAADAQPGEHVLRPRHEAGAAENYLFDDPVNALLPTRQFLVVAADGGLVQAQVCSRLDVDTQVDQADGAGLQPGRGGHLVAHQHAQADGPPFDHQPAQVFQVARTLLAVPHPAAPRRLAKRLHGHRRPDHLRDVVADHLHASARLPTGAEQPQLLVRGARRDVKGRRHHEMAVADVEQADDLIDHFASRGILHAAEEGQPAGRLVERDFHEARPLPFGQERAFSGRAADEQAVDAGLDQPADRPSQGRLVHPVVGVGRRQERRDDAGQIRRFRHWPSPKAQPRRGWSACRCGRFRRSPGRPAAASAAACGRSRRRAACR